MHCFRVIVGWGVAAAGMWLAPPCWGQPVPIPAIPTLPAPAPVAEAVIVKSPSTTEECHSDGGFPPFGTGMYRVPVAPPAGYSLRQWNSAQVARGEMQKLFILPHEWYLGGTSLGPAGRRHLDRLVRVLLDGSGSIYLEPSGDVKLDQARFHAIVGDLKRYGISDPARRVALAYPLGEGIYGEDAVIAYPRLFIQSRGLGGGIGGGGIGGLGMFGGFGGMNGYGGNLGLYRGY